MHITSPTPIQLQAIPAMLQGRDVVGQARTGSGKTLAFALPIVERCDLRAQGIQAIVLVPTRELAIQVGGVLSQVAEGRGMRVALLYGGRSLLPERENLRRGPHVVVGTPGRTLDHLKRGDLRLEKVRIVVLDEGDEMLDRGFGPDVERILSRAPAQRQTALFSATMPSWIQATAEKYLHDAVTVRADELTSPPPEIQHVVYEVDPGLKLEALTSLLDRRPNTSVLVFGRTKHGVKKFARQLALKGFPVGALQGNLSQNARERVLSQFRSGELTILFATNVAARGLDIEGVGQVINFELPESAELFTHRVGRTGRMGREGEAITLVTPDDAPKLREIERILGRRLPRSPFPGFEPTVKREVAATAPAQPVRRPQPRPFEGRRTAPPTPAGPPRPRDGARPAAPTPTHSDAPSPANSGARRRRPQPQRWAPRSPQTA